MLVLSVKSVNSLDKNEIESYESDLEPDIMEYVEDFINLPKGGTSWKIFGDTGMDEYPIKDNDGNVWMGVRPNFTDEIKTLNSREILVQGYMFPLDQEEKQSTFLLVPFPLSCPYHPHVMSNLIIEIHAINPINFSYDPINIRGILELVPKDDEFNIFFRIRSAKSVSQ